MREIADETARVVSELGLERPPCSISALPAEPGLYALWARREEALKTLALATSQAPALLERPLYVGKAQDSIRKRVAETHFCTGKTGWSTVRRTLSALIGLEACPRPGRGHPTNYGLVPADEERLTKWMNENLDVRQAPSRWTPLETVERELLAILRPPLNADKEARSEFRQLIAERRRAMAAHSRGES